MVVGRKGSRSPEVELPEPAPDEPPPNWREGLISEDWDERMTALMLEYLHHERDTQGNGFELMTHMSEIRSVLMRFNEGNGDIYHLRYAAEQLVAFLMLDIEGHLAVKRSERHLALRRARKRDENAAPRTDPRQQETPPSEEGGVLCSPERENVSQRSAPRRVPVRRASAKEAALNGSRRGSLHRVSGAGFSWHCRDLGAQGGIVLHHGS